MHGCGDDAAKCALPFADGDPTGHADPLGAGPGQARAGRIHAAQLPAVPSGLVTWADNDFVLANNKVAIVIEDVGDSDLYDPWGGRPVGLARVENGAMVEPSNFGEFFVMTGRSTVVTESVSVINDGSDGKPAVIRARGKLHPIPFFESLTGILYNDEYTDIEAAIDYELAPDADDVVIRMRYHSPRNTETNVPSTMHGLMYSGRNAPDVFQPTKGFDSQLDSPYVAFVEDNATSWAYMPGEGNLSSSIAASGFLGAFGPGYKIPKCGTDFDRVAAKIVIAGPGLDPVQAAASTLLGEDRSRTFNVQVVRGAVPQPGVHVHVLDASGSYITRGTTDLGGHVALHLPPTPNLSLEIYTRTDGLYPAGTINLGDSLIVQLPDAGYITVNAQENGAAVPARVQVLANVTPVPSMYGEPAIGPSPSQRTSTRRSRPRSTTSSTPPASSAATSTFTRGARTTPATRRSTRFARRSATASSCRCAATTNGLATSNRRSRSSGSTSGRRASARSS